MNACNLCGGAKVEVAHANVFGQGVSLVRCVACGFKFYDRTYMQPEAFYNSPANDDFAERSYMYGSQVIARQTDEQAPANKVFLVSYYGAVLDQVAHVLGRQPRTLYEVGCDWGAFLRVAHDRGIRATGCDLNRRAAEIAQKRMGLDVAAGAFLALDVPTEQDVVVLFDVIEHIPNPRDVMERVWGMLASGGIAAIKTFYDEYHQTVPLDLSPARHMDRGLKTTGYFDPTAHPCHFDLPVLRALMARVGLNVVKETLDEVNGQVTLFVRRPAA